MSGKLQIRFAPDMPGAAVEVMSPSLETVGRVWLEPGNSTALEVPSEASFLRLHLPSGQTVTLHDPGNMTRQVDLKALQSATARPSPPTATGRRPRQSVGELRSARQARARGVLPMAGQAVGAAACQLGDGTQISLAARGANATAGTVDPEGHEALLHPSLPASAYDLRVLVPGGIDLRVRVPGRARDIHVAVDEVDDDLSVLGVRIKTEHELADTLGAYTARGDLHSAASMTTWIDGAEEMLLHKLEDPCAAAQGAYLLLRLRRFDLMRSWARNLADKWPELADGSIVWAWQQIHQRGDEAEIRKYLQQAAAAELPVFTEGLKLLGEGLRLIEGGSGAGSRQLNAMGLVQWDSPFTAHVPGTRRPGGPRWRFDVGYATSA